MDCIDEKKPPLSSRFITLIAVLSPILAMYGTGIATITILDVAILLSFIVAPLSSGIHEFMLVRGQQRIILLLIALVIFNFFITIGTGGADSDVGVLLRTMRYILYLAFSMLLLKDKYFDVRFAIRVYGYVSLFASMYLIVQFILLYGFNYSLQGYLSFLPIMREELETFSSGLFASSYSRPRSIFAEPSQLGLYTAGYLGIIYFCKIKENNKYSKWVIMLAMLMSASSTAEISLAILIVSYIAKQIKEKKFTGLILPIALATGAIVITSLGGFLNDRLILTIQRLPSSFLNRVNGFYEFAERSSSFSIINLLFGIGMNTDSMTVWYSGVAKILLYFGSVGMLVFLIVVICGFMQKNSSSRKYFCFFLILSIFSEMLMSNWLILYLPFVMRNIEEYYLGDCVYEDSTD